MAIPELDRLVRIGQLKVGAAASSEINGLMRSGLARLKDAESADLSLESRFDLAYNAAHALAHTVSLPAEQWRVLDEAHRQRNLAEYEGVVEIEQSQVDAICRVTRVVGDRVAALVASRHA